MVKLLVLLLSLRLLFYGIPVLALREEDVYRSVKTNSMKIAITFDDGPHPSLTPRILEILERYGVKATFFMVGVNVVNYPEVAKAVIDAGHEVGNHTFSHLTVAGVGERTLQAEVERCEDALEELCEYRPQVFRPPQGALDPCVTQYAKEADYSVVLWSLDTKDWEVKDAQRIAHTVLSQVRAGDIILLHDYIGRKSKTPEALEVLLPELLAHGFEPVTVRELLSD